MHYLVKLLVEGGTAKEALENAEMFAQDLCGQNESGYDDFDWYDLDGRWGASKAYGVESKKGKKLIEEAMNGTRREFESAMAHIRYMVEHFSDEQIFEEQFGTNDDQAAIRKENEKVYYLSRYQFTVAGGSHSNSCYLYNDKWGGRVTNQHDLDHIMKDTDKKLWVVAVDFHN